MEDIIRSLLISNWEVIPLVGYLVATSVVYLLVKILLKCLGRKLEKADSGYHVLLNALHKPIGFGIWVLGLGFAVEGLSGHFPSTMESNFLALFRLFRVCALAVLFGWFSFNFIRFFETQTTGTGFDHLSTDPGIPQIVARTLRIAVVVMCSLYVLQAVGVRVSGILAFGGITGAILTFAAQDYFSNFFGSAMVRLDRQFSVGDHIRTVDSNIEGTVEEVGLRLTRVRTLDHRPLYVPNSIFLKTAVENVSRMEKHRIYEKVGLRCDDIARLSAMVDDVTNMLHAHPDIDLEPSPTFTLDSFGETSLNMLLSTCIKTTGLNEYQMIKQDVLFKIVEIVSAHGASLAIPSQVAQTQISTTISPT